MTATSFTYQFNSKNSVLVISEGDITAWKGDAIVNAANERMLGGGGVDGAIHRAAGGALLQACKNVKEVAPGVRCPTGEARITPGFELPAKYVIHTVGPVYRSPEASAPLLKSAYQSSLKLANDNGVQTIAFPAISTGVYGYPLQEAAEVSLSAAAEAVGAVKEVHFILFGKPALTTFKSVADKMFGASSGAAGEL